MEENVWSHNKIKNPELKKSGLQKIRGYVCKSETKKKNQSVQTHVHSKVFMSI